MFVVRSGELYARFMTAGNRRHPTVREVTWMGGDTGLREATKFPNAEVAQIFAGQVGGIDEPPRVEEI